jgi:predicted nucleotidyltransferase
VWIIENSGEVNSMIKFGKGLQEDILEKALRNLPDVFKKYPNIVAAYIFGSHAARKTTDLSDLDIAILLRKKIGFEEELDLIGNISDVLHTDDFDLVILNDSPPYIQYEVFSKGKIFYETDEEYICDFQATAFQKYFDIKPIYDEYNYYLKKRIMEGRMLSE